MSETHQNVVGSDNDDYSNSPSRYAFLTQPESEPIRAAFWSKVRRVEPLRCWLWQGARGDKFGHGAVVFRFARGGKQIHEYAHRVAWMLAKGPIPPRKQVNHLCDVPLCVNPDHLYVGTQLDNMRDASERGRFPLTRKPRKLTDDAVRSIRVLVAQGVKQRLVAEAFGVSPASIHQIVNGHRRTHVKAQIAPVEREAAS